ncbi:hypothetical protein FPOAC2_14427 [Fusarium poae]
MIKFSFSLYLQTTMAKPFQQDSDGSVSHAMLPSQSATSRQSCDGPEMHVVPVNRGFSVICMTSQRMIHILDQLLGQSMVASDTVERLEEMESLVELMGREAQHIARQLNMPR